MHEATVKIVNKHGLHARTAAKLSELARSFACTIELGPNEDRLINVKSIVAVLTLGAAFGDELILRTAGTNEAAALQELTELIGNGFDGMD